MNKMSDDAREQTYYWSDWGDRVYLHTSWDGPSWETNEREIFLPKAMFDKIAEKLKDGQDDGKYIVNEKDQTFIRYED